MRRMHTSESGKLFIKNEEKYRARAYRCSAGKWTIGWGETEGVKEGDWTSLEEAEERFGWRIAQIDNRLWKLFSKAGLNQSQWDALASLSYNVGAVGVVAPKLTRFVQERQWQEAAAEFDDIIMADGKPSNGLIARRAREKALFLSLLGVGVH